MEQQYSVKELKAIVDYLSLHKAYGEVTGKKVWMDLAASSKVTNRTWQSLKNAYFKLCHTELTKTRHRLHPKQGICSTSKDCEDDEVQQLVESEEEIIDRNSANEKEGEREKNFSSLTTLNLSIINEKYSSQAKNAEKRMSDISQNNSNQEALQENSNLRSNKNLENGLKRANSQELEKKNNKRISCGTGRRSLNTERRKCTISHSSEMLSLSLPVLSLREDCGPVEDNNAVVQNGQSPNNNDTCTREDELAQDVVFWKLLYSKEKEKTEELRKLINQTKGEESQRKRR
ncbi:uncharacterized protein LOC123869112 [Maniola jurtina]|uniref:uncharacterized protein LOC123869112 n=1 Tax=Maniola jurtina TaxID=191418 RepID=UPI001E688525|nr:uncharacterized protein LOC123869112 [Maniola jurtina]